MDDFAKDQTVAAKRRTTDGMMQRRQRILDGVAELLRHIPQEERVAAVLHAAQVTIRTWGFADRWVEENWKQLVDYVNSTRAP